MTPRPFEPLTTIDAIDGLTLSEVIAVETPADFPEALRERMVSFTRELLLREPGLLEEALDGYDDDPPYTDPEGLTEEHLCDPLTTEALGSCESYGHYSVEVFTLRGQPYLTMVSTRASNNVSFLFDESGELRFEMSDLVASDLTCEAIVALSHAGLKGASIADLKATGKLARVHERTGGAYNGVTYARRLFGDRYVGPTHSGLMHGEGTWTSAEGDTYTGHFKWDRRHGRGTYTAADGTVRSGQWEDDEYIGPG